MGKKQNSIDEKEDEIWDSVLRATILSSTTQRLYSLISTADQKAQGLILLNSIIVPIAISQMDNPDLQYGMIMAILTAVFSILTAILCVYPKRRGGSKPDGTKNYLHFGDIGRMREEDYLKEFRPFFNNPQKLSEVAVKDLHDISRRILMPKFFWLKTAYIVFFMGNVLAITTIIYSIPKGG
jgi:hypothetical protein